ncbi:MAG: phytoene desaturase family protein [Christensenellales bacterium]
MKKIVIIGAGIAGLTCGIYLQLNGFETQIHEMHTVPGGECTGWSRGEYHFDGCIHWLMGSKPGSPMNDLWYTTGALNDSVRIINHEIFARYEENGRHVNLYTNADKLKEHFLEISPRDKTEISKLAKAIKAMGSFGMPLDKPMDMMTAGDGLRFAAKNITELSMLSRFNKIRLADYAKLFKEPLLQKAILSVIPGDYNANALVMTLSGMHAGDSGAPHGGSRALAQRMAQRYADLGGKIFYKSRADKILVRDGSAAGVLFTDGSEAGADIVVSCADGYATLYKMLENKFTPQVYKNLFENPKNHYLPTCAIVFMGVDCRISGYRALNIKRSPVMLNGIMTDSVSLLNYSYDSTMAPEGKTVMACYYNADFDYWHALSQNGEQYELEKEKLKQDAAAMLIARYPEAEGRIERTDVVTPMTYVHYCDAFRGAWMSWGSGQKDVPQYFSGKLPGLSNFLMAGMWTLPPGGLPGASASGRFAAHRICLEEGIPFQTK